MSDHTHAKGPVVHQVLHLTLGTAEGDGDSQLDGRITHVGLSDVTASFLTTSGPFTATLPHDWLAPSEASNEWTASARLAPVDPAAIVARSTGA